MKQAKDKVYFVDMLADSLDEGTPLEQAYNILSSELSRQKSKIKFNQVIKEFKMLYGHDPEHYVIFKNAESTFIDQSLDDELLEAFSKKMGS